MEQPDHHQREWRHATRASGEAGAGSVCLETFARRFDSIGVGREWSKFSSNMQIRGPRSGGRQTAKDSGIGTIEEVLPSALFRVRLADGRRVLAGMAPRLKHVVVRLIGGSRVRVELSARDPNRGRIVEKL